MYKACCSQSSPLSASFANHTFFQISRLPHMLEPGQSPSLAAVGGQPLPSAPVTGQSAPIAGQSPYLAAVAGQPLSLAPVASQSAPIAGKSPYLAAVAGQPLPLAPVAGQSAPIAGQSPSLAAVAGQPLGWSVSQSICWSVSRSVGRPPHKAPHLLNALYKKLIPM